MKKTYTILFLLLFAIFCKNNQTIGQSTSTGNLISGMPNEPYQTTPILDYLGWDASVMSS
jgi:hypothetical protein